MSPPRIAFGLAAAVSLMTAPAQAQDSYLWANVGSWEVSVDPTISNGCYAVATWDGGTVLRIGLNPEESNFYFLLGNDKWRSLQPNEPYALSIAFGNRTPWDVSSTGLQFNPGETVYLHAESTNMEFVREFQRANNMKVSYKGEEIDNLRLTGSRRAWDEVENCQGRNGRKKGDDPFAE